MQHQRPRIVKIRSLLILGFLGALASVRVNAQNPMPATISATPAATSSVPTTDQHAASQTPEASASAVNEQPTTAVTPLPIEATPTRSVTNPTPKTEVKKSDFTAPQGYSFNPLNVKRDPFTSPAVDAAKGPVSELERYDVSEMKLVAIMQGFGRPQAMLVLPNSQTHIVKEGDRVGKRGGRVAKITTTEVQVKESFRDFQNREKTDITAMVLVD